jgi:hypothetical protein
MEKNETGARRKYERKKFKCVRGRIKWGEIEFSWLVRGLRMGLTFMNVG